MTKNRADHHKLTQIPRMTDNQLLLKAAKDRQDSRGRVKIQNSEIHHNKARIDPAPFLILCFYIPKAGETRNLEQSIGLPNCKIRERLTVGS
jgi:hypothetical protein